MFDSYVPSNPKVMKHRSSTDVIIFTIDILSWYPLTLLNNVIKDLWYEDIDNCLQKYNDRIIRL